MAFSEFLGLAPFFILGIMASFFWIRGVWRDALSDRQLSWCLFAVICVLGTVFSGGSACGMNFAGAWLCLLGFATMIGGFFLKSRGWSFQRACFSGVLMILVGAILALML
jgi:hypothetical protein